MSIHEDPSAALARIGTLLRDARAAKQLTIRDVSEKAREHLGEPLGQSRYSNYEQGLRRMSVATAAAVGKVLGLDSAELVVPESVGRQHLGEPVKPAPAVARTRAESSMVSFERTRAADLAAFYRALAGLNDAVDPNDLESRERAAWELLKMMHPTLISDVELTTFGSQIIAMAENCRLAL